MVSFPNPSKRPMTRLAAEMIAGKEGLKRLDNSLCVTCGRSVDPSKDFKDTLSIKEFGISGMCQTCQDSVFDIKDPGE